ncbi:GNAT family N-acetyltransferase [Colwellia sp. 4_MG-2023]|uniref:GNAT family N-acetyltransferase n=1 Tax=unclassified Colwellia TaxID=196834 RepID=UPI001C088631|nr:MULTISPECIES: GNAT family N-acetyltransferase [unclassified Colwellia]MBU2923947.1 GNAT family N-acetyltransferase [Colwellia sp. C2M11]MDO6507224.1 GNAT family N-acetyltransferase [Colwellia sp. 5_MG-2023]MDO6555432.1 GNAT family N-acetyltransferase [Colwellia sp. 4_MG-2023]MDO6653415.1 GNAT family N-acetyltransferase [Colwellia sp. 3_MG-2023]MDO6666199.1 GNAT family N-acetyltransferase [Colwellia sp. 2_MG-2023]
MKSFTTKRLLIRPLEETDKAFYISLYSDAKIMRNIGPPLTSIEATEAFTNTLTVMQKKKPKVMVWVIIDLKSNNLIGLQALYNKTPNITEIGIMLATQFNGMLFPEEAIGSLIEYGFNHLNLQQINAHFAKANLATARVAKKTGFVCDTSKQPLDSQQRIDSVYKDTWHRHYIKTIIG